MTNIIEIKELSKQYATGHKALKSVNLNIKQGEILALLGPNGAGKTTLISIICGLTNATNGKILIAGLDNIKNYRKTREMIGLVPQEISLGMFEKVWDSIHYSRGLRGKKPNNKWITEVLKCLSLYEKKDNIILELSGGMKRRVLIAKALSHQPKILFLDEPTAGVDVALRKNMWQTVEQLRKTGVTIILTTHYIEEAEAIADRIGVINKGELILIENKANLMKKMGKQRLKIILSKHIDVIPKELESYQLNLSNDGLSLVYEYNTKTNKNCIDNLIKSLTQTSLKIQDLQTKKSSLEDIFIDLVK